MNPTTSANDNEYPLWDSTVLSRMMGDNPVMQNHLLEKFLIYAEERVNWILQATEAKDFSRVRSLAHALKSSSRTAGAMQIGELCMAMEKAGEAGDTHACIALSEKLNKMFASTATIIRRNLE